MTKRTLSRTRTEIEEQLAAIWQGVLQLDRISVYDNFFSLGGHSLLAVQAMTRTRAALGTDLPMAALFAAPTIAGLANRISGASKSADHGDSASWA